MADAIAINFADPIPLFPLPGCLLLPHATIPLHIFEPRYRQMTTDCLENKGIMALASFADENWKQSYQDNPAIRPHVCVGYVLRHQKLESGRYNLLLQGLCRARIVRELPGGVYRTALLEPTEPEPVMEIDLRERRSGLEKLLGDPLLQQLRSVHRIRQWLSDDISTAALVDLCVLEMTEDQESRYRMLAEPDFYSRLRWLEGYLGDTRHTLQIAGKLIPGGDIPDYISLN